jgi:hypothetical protein
MCNIVPATITTATRIFGHIYGGVVRSLDTIPTDCEPTRTPPHVRSVELPAAFLLEWAYTGKRLEDDTPSALKRRVYGVLSEYNSRCTTPIPIRIHERHPHKNWRAIWKKVSMAHLQDTVTSVWCRATHHILPTN